MLAAQLEDPQILELLLTKGAHAGAIDKAQRSALVLRRAGGSPRGREGPP